MLMQVLLLDQESGFYVGYHSSWSDNAQEAKDFSFTVHARAMARQLNLKSFQVLFYFPENDYRIVVSDDKSGTELASV